MGKVVRERMFSGIQPTGGIHIGNYLGALRHWIALQVEYESIFCIVDLHAITNPREPARLRADVHEAAGLLFAAGIDPESSRVFVQSHVSAHAELAWILSCLTPVGWMRRMTQFKEKSYQQQEQVSVGLFAYPALMAADILLYETDLVPVGEDQKQHLEYTRDIARRFNTTYGETFRLPKAVIPATGARVMGLDDPTKKMSKSETHTGHAVYLLDSPDEIRSKIMKARTDSLRDIRFDESRPGVHNLLLIYKSFTGLTRPEIEAHFEGKGYAELKQELAEVIVESLRPLQSRYLELAADPVYVASTLARGASDVEPIAQRMLGRVKERIGLG